MKRRLIFAGTLFALCLFLNSGEASAQTDELPKFEIGGHFSSLTFNSADTEPGLGVRFTYNVNRNLAFEAEGNLFPHDARERSFRNGGRATQGLFGVKIGKRYQR
ncbi:MAG: hypothetical protein ICV68_06295, partial [Pyrinomonadaceae bacterium]|nr:hypothetical protein [Pyrinomonadaceae bacterium]